MSFITANRNKNKYIKSETYSGSFGNLFSTQVHQSVVGVDDVGSVVLIHCNVLVARRTRVTDFLQTS